MIFSLCFATIAVCFGFAHWRNCVAASRISGLQWQELLGKLEPLPIEGITTVAMDFLQPERGQIGIDTDELWKLIGGSDGLRKMRANAEILIALAALAQQWNFDESIIVAERMRRDGLALRRACIRIDVCLFSGIGKTRGPFSIQEAASAYYLMRRRLLMLYETSHVGRLSVIASVV